MKNFRFLSLVLILLLAVSLLPVSAMAVSDPDITARAAILLDKDSGEVYYEKNADARIQPASTTKIVTALLVVEAVERGEISLSDNVAASENSLYNLVEDSSDATPRIQPGEVMTVQDLLYCAMLASANEACNILAEYMSGTVLGFVDRMNARVEELGCTGTHFANANGLEEEGHYSTAADFAIIAREAMTHSLFEQICGTLNYTVPATNVNDSRELVNTNMLLNKDSEFYYSYADGIKTGYFTNAGYCLVSSAEKDGMSVIAVVMGSENQNDQFRDSITLYDWMFENFEVRQVLSSTETIVTVPVRMGTSDTIGVRAEDAVSVILPKDYDISRVSYNYVLYHEVNDEKLEAPINVGEVLGEISVVELDGAGDPVRTFGSSLLVASSSVDMSRMDYMRTQITELFQEPLVRRIITILIILLAVYLLLVVFYLIQRARHLRSLREAKRERAARQTQQEAEALRFPQERSSEPPIDYFAGTEEPAPALEDTVPEEPEPPVEQKPRRSVPRNDFIADDDFFDSFFKS